MSKIFGFDLGTNSIGWALRDTNLTENQIEKFGVLTFNKGVGLGKTGEYSYAAQRTKKRSTRRLYQARKYRLWATLEVLIDEGYCPLPIEDLNKWRHYSKEEARKNNNAGRVYPVWNTAFDAWIKLDFDNDGKPDYTSPYQLRKELAETKLDFSKEENRFKLGRALYHIAQRRGFKSSRKGSDDTKEKEINDNEVMDLQYSEKKKNKVIAGFREKYTDAKTIGWLFALLENDKIRIRESIAQYAIRENYKDEIKYIFQEIQKLGLEHSLYKKLVESDKNKNDGSIFYKRPLRSQKGLIGKCTLEPNKYRVPISHPAFETFRAWSFLNNVKYKPFINEKTSYKDNPNEAKELPLELKQEIYSELFFWKSKAYFPFSEIVASIMKKGNNWQLNYSLKTTVTACPVSARLKDIFGDDYLNAKIKKDQKSKSGKDYYDIEDIWHVLFSYEDQEYVAEFAKEKLKLSDQRINEKEKSDVEKFVIAWNACPVGYGMLSLNAINKINVFLQKGLIYTEAVLLAKIPEIIGKELWQQNEKLLMDSISGVIDENRQQKTILNIVNSLISKHKNLDENKFGDKDYKLDESDLKDIQTAVEEQFGSNKWNGFPEDEKATIFNTVKDCYQAYFTKQGVVRDAGREERIVTVQSGNKNYYKTESGYYQLPKLIDTMKEFLQDNFEHLDEKKLSKIYHPSEINIYPPAKEDKDGVLKLGSPKTGSFQYRKDANTSGFKTLDEIKKQVVDEGLKVQIEKQVNKAGGLKEAFEKGIYLLDKNGNPHGNKIRHIRVWASVSEPLAIKKQTNLSDKEYKQSYWAANATNSFFAIYKGEDLIYSIRRNLFEVAGQISKDTKNANDLFESKIFVIKEGRTVRELTQKEIRDGKTGTELLLVSILEKGTKVIFKNNDEDFKSLSHSDILKRLYVYTNFEKDGRLNFQYHLEARNKIEETYSKSEIDFSIPNPKPTLRFSYGKYDFAVEGYDFEIKMDGTIKMEKLKIDRLGNISKA
jgi:CRISPR-associated endonuclease Csn1